MFLHEFEFPRRNLRYAFPLKVLAFDADQRTEVTLFPDLTNFEQDPLVCETKVTALGEDYQPTATLRFEAAHWRRILEWLVANRSGHRQAIHILQQCRLKSQKD